MFKLGLYDADESVNNICREQLFWIFE